jgi:hypothetical protein
MTTLLLSLIVAQAALLFWASIHLSNVFMLHDKKAQVIRCVVTLIIPLAIAVYGARIDPHRILCGMGDGLGLIVGVSYVRFWAVSKEEEQRAQEREFKARRAAAKAEAEREAEEAERLRVAAAALEAKQAIEIQRATNPPMPPRHLAPSLLRGGTRSPRFPSGPRK